MGRFGLPAAVAVVGTVASMAAATARATTYYVRVSGCDCADGLSPATAFASIGHAAALVREGDRIVVAPGVYDEGDLSPADDGRPGFPVEFFADRAGLLAGDPAGEVLLRPPPGRTTGFLLLGREFVVIDGFTIADPLDAGVQARTAPDGRAASNITVRNVTVTGAFRRGIDIQAREKVVVASCTAIDSRGAGIAVVSAGGDLEADIRDNRVAGGAGNGLFVDGATAGRIEGNTVEDNAGAGLFLRRSPGLLVRDNVFRCNGSNGLQTGTSLVELADADGLTLSGNTAEDNGGSGFRILAGGFVRVEGNSALRNGGTGIVVEGAAAQPARPELAGNLLGGNGGHGIFLRRTAQAEVRNTLAWSNAATGATLRASEGPRVVNNLLYDNGEDGIAAGSGDEPVSGAVLAFNTVYANGGWGVRIGSAAAGSPEAVVVYNVLHDNVAGELTITRDSACGYVAGYNLVGSGRYGPSTPASPYDLVVPPLFVDPDGRDGVLGGEGFADDDFRLRSSLFGTSPGIDVAPVDAADLGVSGSATERDLPDAGPADLGFHYGAAAEGFRVAPPFMPIYVRATGSDTHTGKAPERALRSLRRAAKAARAGVTVVVGPGEYAEGDVGPPAGGGLAAFLADTTGRLTGDPPGPVTVDASGRGTGFLLVDSCRASVQGFRVRGAADAAIQVRAGADGALVRDNVVTESKIGIQVFDANGVSIVNNLVVGNRGGIQVGGHTGARGTEIRSNTVYGSEQVGILLGAGAPAPEAVVRYNIVCGSGKAGIQVSGTDSLQGYAAARNLNCDGYAAGTPEGRLDLTLPPVFVDPEGGDFRLSQTAAGEPADSPGVDYADVSAAEAGLGERTTRSDGVPDRSSLDLGYHFPLPVRPEVHVCASGNDDAPGTAGQPVATLSEALRRAAPGTRVVPCPGRFPGPVVIDVPRLTLAATAGSDGLPQVTLDAACAAGTCGDGASGYAVRIESEGVELRGLAITGGAAGGVWVGADRAAIVDSRVEGNGGDGIRLARGNGALLFNLVVRDNGGDGVHIGETGRDVSAPIVGWVTSAANDGAGIAAGADGGTARDVVLLANALEGNQGPGIAILPSALPGLTSGFNCNGDGYEGIAASPSDVTADPLLVGDFFLAHEAAGQGTDSPCLDATPFMAGEIGLAGAWTRSDGLPDSGVADPGYHHGASALPAETLRTLLRGSCAAGACMPVAGDCDGNGTVTVDELVRGVRLAVGADPPGTCPVFDLDGDGAVGVHELVAAVVAALRGGRG